MLILSNVNTFCILNLIVIIIIIIIYICLPGTWGAAVPAFMHVWSVGVVPLDAVAMHWQAEGSMCMSFCI